MIENDPPRLVLALHSHQPTGNVEDVFEQAHDECYEPLLGALDRFPAVLMSLHYSGPLLEWMESRRPATIALVRGLAARGQVEILGGGWQEPILSAVPPRDALGQLRTMRYECARLFGVMPRGMWLAERVWEPDVPWVAGEAGYAFTLVDDTHLRHAGVLEEEITGWYATEKWGRTLGVFPISRSLRYAIPFREPEATFEILASRPGRTWTYGDDGEKLGLWPGTREWVWDKGWLVRFLEAITRRQAESRIVTALPSRIMASEGPAGRVYMPTASYREMGEWSLPAAAAARLVEVRRRLEKAGIADLADPFVHGGTWAGFLSKYPESNWMHKRMLRVSGKVAAAEKREKAATSFPLQEARRDLYRSQTNCAYWHGLFGGLYLPHLRRALWLHMLRAENAVDPLRGEARVTRSDLDCDGLEEILVETSRMTCAIAPSMGAAAIEIVHRPSCLNLTDVLARRPELYHTIEEKAGERASDGIDSIHSMPRRIDETMRGEIVYDAVMRRAFQEQILASASLEPIERGTAPVLADLASSEWQVRGVEEAEGRREISLGISVPVAGGRLEVSKRYAIHLDRARIAALYELRWDGSGPLDAVLAVRMNLGLLEDGSPDRFYEVTDPPLALGEDERRLTSRGTWDGVASVSIVDTKEKVRVTLSCSPVAVLHRHGVCTVSQTEGGYTLTYQGSCLAFAWPLRLESWVDWPASLSLDIF